MVLIFIKKKYRQVKKENTLNFVWKNLNLALHNSARKFTSMKQVKEINDRLQKTNFKLTLILMFLFISNKTEMRENNRKVITDDLR